MKYFVQTVAMLIVVGIVVINADSFSTVANSVGGVFVESVRTLQYRPG